MTTIQTTTQVGSVQPAMASVGDVGESSPAALLPEPASTSLGGDSMTALATLIAQADQQDSTSARKLEDEANSAAVAQDERRVSQMNDKATQDEDGGWATGIGDVLGGVATSVGGFLPGGANASAKTDARLVAEGVGKTLPGVGTIVAASYKAAADRDDASAASFEAGSQLALRRYDAARSEQQAADASVEKVAQFLQTLQQTQNDSRSAAASMLKG